MVCTVACRSRIAPGYWLSYWAKQNARQHNRTIGFLQNLTEWDWSASDADFCDEGGTAPTRFLYQTNAQTHPRNWSGMASSGYQLGVYNGTEFEWLSSYYGDVDFTPTVLKSDDESVAHDETPCPIMQQANAASGTSGLQNGTSRGAIRFLGTKGSCAECQLACQRANRTAEGQLCRSWVWWYAGEQVAGFARGCYGRYDGRWPPAENIPKTRHHVCSGVNCAAPPSGYRPPAPAPPSRVAVPTSAQLAWQQRELGAMITFGMQTYKLLPVGTRNTVLPAAAFSPNNEIDTDVWVRAAQSFGAKYAVLVASHRSGFALWPTKSHNYSVASSSCKSKDILKDFVASCRRYGLVPGVFWTQRFNDYFGVANHGVVNATQAAAAHGQQITQDEYDAMMSTQLTELARYGFEEFWVNGEIDGRAAQQLTAQVAALFPNATCHSCAGVPTQNNIRCVLPAPLPDLQTLLAIGGFAFTDAQNFQSMIKRFGNQNNMLETQVGRHGRSGVWT